MSSVLLAPFRHVACPRLDLSVPDTTALFTPTAIFTLVMLSYYFIISGVRPVAVAALCFSSFALQHAVVALALTHSVVSLRR